MESGRERRVEAHLVDLFSSTDEIELDSPLRNFPLSFSDSQKDTIR